MFCTRCGRPLEAGASACPSCGQPVAASEQPLTGPATPTPPLLLTTSPLEMVWDKLSLMTNFQFRDDAGRTLGVTHGEIAFPVKYTLQDDRGEVVLTLDAQRVHGLLYDFMVHDAAGRVLATIRQESSFLSRKYAVSIDGRPDYLLTTDAAGYHCAIHGAADGSAVATAERKPALRTSTTRVEIAEGAPLDRRVILGAMILVVYLTTRQ